MQTRRKFRKPEKDNTKETLKILMDIKNGKFTVVSGDTSNETKEAGDIIKAVRPLTWGVELNGQPYDTLPG